MGRGAVVVVSAAALGAAVVGGCSTKPPSPAAESASSPVVAQVGNVSIHLPDLASQMRRTASDRRRALDELITFEVLAQAAAQDGLDAKDEPEGVDAEPQQQLRALKVQRLLEREIEPHLARDAVADSDVRALYERAKPRFVHGRLVEIAILSVFTGARMKPEPRARASSVARALGALVHARGMRTAAELEALAKDPIWTERKVTFTTTWQGEDQPFPAVVGRAVQSLSRPGEMTELVEDETGSYIAMYLSEKPPANVSFNEAAPILRDEMYEPWRRQRFLQLTLTLAQGHAIEVFPENFSAMAEDSSSPR